MNGGSRGSSPLSSRFVLCCVALVIAALASSCQSLGDWFKGDFNVTIEGAPKEVASVYFILGDSKVLEEPKDPERIGDLTKQSMAEKYWEIAEFRPDRDKLVWERDYHRNTEGDTPRYYCDTYVKANYTLLITVHRSEFREHPQTAIAVLVHHTNGAWSRCVVTENDFHNKKEARIIVRMDSVEMQVTRTKRDLLDDDDEAEDEEQS